MAEGFFLTRPDRNAVSEVIRRGKGDPRGKRGQLTGLTLTPRMPPHRIAVCYGGLTAAVYGSGGELTTPGVGEVKLHKMFTDGSGVSAVDDDPISVLSLIDVAVADGEEVVLAWDASVCQPDDEEDFEPKYFAISLHGALNHPIELCRTTDQTVAVDTETTIDFPSSINLDPSAYYARAGTDPTKADSIVLKKIGWYILGYDVNWAGPITSPGGTSIEMSGGTIFIARLDAGPTFTPLTCSIQPHHVLHDQASGASTSACASKQILHRNTTANTIYYLRTLNGSGTHTRTFKGTFFAEYLGYDKVPTVTVTDET